jgi:hypothetical protein
MLDVHPPHAPTHTWRDFFIHIATICVGLLIAIGLEQSVEWLDHKHQLSEARESLRIEREKNHKLFALQTTTFEHRTPYLQKDLEVFLYLRAHPHAPRESWPGTIVWHVTEIPFVSAAWATAQRDGVIERLPQAEVEHLDELYKRLDEIRADELAERKLSEDAGGYYSLQPDPSNISPHDLDNLIDLTKQLLIAHARIGLGQRRLGGRFTDFPPAPALEPIDRILSTTPTVPADDAAFKAESQRYFSITADQPPSTEPH